MLSPPFTPSSSITGGAFMRAAHYIIMETMCKHGIIGECRKCKRYAYEREWKDKNRNKVREYNRTWMKTRRNTATPHGTRRLEYDCEHGKTGFCQTCYMRDYRDKQKVKQWRAMING